MEKNKWVESSVAEMEKVETKETQIEAIVSEQDLTPNIKAVPKRLTKSVTRRVVSEW